MMELLIGECAVDIEKSDRAGDETTEDGGKPKGIPQKRIRFISDKMFEKLVKTTSTLQWDDLHKGCIYRLDDIVKKNGKTILHLVDRENRIYQTLIPPNVLDDIEMKLSCESRRIDIIFIRQDRDGKIDVVVPETYPCKNCSLEYTSYQSYWNHKKKCIISSDEKREDCK